MFVLGHKLYLPSLLASRIRSCQIRAAEAWGGVHPLAKILIISGSLVVSPKTVKPIKPCAPQPSKEIKHESTQTYESQ